MVGLRTTARVTPVVCLLETNDGAAVDRRGRRTDRVTTGLPPTATT
jgi:hypothetical protein